MLFILAICSSPSRLGPLVQTYRMEYNPGPDADFCQEAIFIGFALRAMCNLEQIEHCASTIMPVLIYQYCTAPLESFSYYRDSKTAPDISSLVYDVLPTQTSLTHIIIKCSSKVRISSKMMKAAEDLCPNLISLSVTNRAIGKMLLQQKTHIQSLQWIVGTSTPSMTVPQYNHLNYLMMLVVTRGLDTSFSQHLSSLALLELWFHNDWDSDIVVSEVVSSKNDPSLGVLIKISI
jgi:hypothetical protein